MATVTAGDFAVELDIDPDSYSSWYKNVYEKAQGDFENKIAPAQSLTLYLTKEIEEELKMQLQ